jgi:hypothetical protein
MKFTFEISNRNQFVEKVNKIGSDKKWFSFVYHTKDIIFYDLKYFISDYEIEVGQCIFTNLKSNIDCSFLIYPEYRGRSLAKMFVMQMIKSHQNIQFTVSLFNTRSLNLFCTNFLLRICEYEIRCKTLTFVLK